MSTPRRSGSECGRLTKVSSSHSKRARRRWTGHGTVLIVDNDLLSDYLVGVEDAGAFLANHGGHE